MSELPGRSVDGDNLHSDAISRAYRAAAREEPSADLDHAIQAAALRAIGSRPGSMTRSPLRRWSVPVTVVAIIVIGVSVAFLATDRDDAVLAPRPDAPTSRALERRDDAVVPRAKVEALKQNATVQEPQSAPTSATESLPAGGEHEARPSRERTAREHRAAIAPRAVLRPEEEAASQSPDLWLQRIRELGAKGELSQAEESLRAFRRRYPDYPIPADLWPAGAGAE